MRQLPLSDLHSSRHPRLLGAAQAAGLAAVLEGQRWREEERLRTVAFARFHALVMSHYDDGEVAGAGSHGLHSFPFRETSEAMEQSLVRMWPRLHVCASQENFDELMERGVSERAVILLAEAPLRLRGQARDNLSLLAFGPLELEIRVEGRLELSLYDDSRARVDCEDTHLVLCDQSKAWTAGAGYVQAYDQAVVHPLSREQLSVHLNGQATCVLGQATTVHAEDGTTVVLTDDADCGDIEIDERNFPKRDEERTWARIVDEEGTLLADGSIVVDDEGKPNYESATVRGIRIVPLIPF